MSGRDPRKPDLSHVRLATMMHCARAAEYAESLGRHRADFLVPAGDGPDAVDKLRGRLRAVVAHAAAVLESLERYEALGGLPETCASIIDFDARPDQHPSLLPHMTHLVGAVNVAVAGAVADGLLAPDPGRPWTINLDTKARAVVVSAVDEEPDPRRVPEVPTNPHEDRRPGRRRRAPRGRD